MTVTKTLFDDLIKEIKAARWFTEDFILTRNGNYIHVAKKNWHDENGKGVHFETYIEDSDVETEEFPIFLHAEKDVPKRDAFVQNVVIAMGDHTNDFMCFVNEHTIVQRFVPFKKEMFVADAMETLDEMQFLVPIVDICLKK
jgi:hypothetical protein